MFISSSLRLQTTILLLLSVLMLQGCGGDNGESNSDTGRINIGDDDEPRYCLDYYEPVCGKALPEFPINCVQAPCTTHEYRTFSNTCYAAQEDAQFSFQDECGGLEERLAFEDKPIQIKELAEVPIDNAPVTMSSVEIKGDIVTLEVSYSGGCGTHEFNLFVSNLFMESNPVQTESILSHVTEDACEALITEKLTFDLLPIREFYQRSYGQGSASVNIQGIGLYSFE